MAVDFEWESGNSPEDLAAKFEAFDSALDRHLESAMENVVTKIAGDASEKAPYETGNLSSKIRGRVLPVMNNVVKGVVGTNVKYAEFVHDGTAPHTIKGSPLAFESGGETQFATTVQHPGTDPNPFLERAVKENRDYAREQFEEAIQDAADEVGLS